MNFLAHLHLAPPTPAGWIGSLAPDLLRGRDLRACDPALHDAIAQHRRVDAFTDTHPIFLRTRARLFPAHGRFAGILVDVFYDHVLARDWRHWHNQPLDVFLTQVRDAFHHHAALIPPAMQPVLARMRSQRWIESYATIPGIAAVLARMEHRFTERFGRTVELARAAADLARQSNAITADFTAFYPQLQARCGHPTPLAAAAGARDTIRS